MWIVEGDLTMTVGEETKSLGAGDVVVVNPGIEHELVSVPSAQCGGYLRVDPADPDRSFLLMKLTEPPAGCGAKMPIVGLVTPEEFACIRAYVHQIAATLPNLREAQEHARRQLASLSGPHKRLIEAQAHPVRYSDRLEHSRLDLQREFEKQK